MRQGSWDLPAFQGFPPTVAATWTTRINPRVYWVEIQPECPHRFRACPRPEQRNRTNTELWRYTPLAGYGVASAWLQFYFVSSVFSFMASLTIADLTERRQKHFPNTQPKEDRHETFPVHCPFFQLSADEREKKIRSAIMNSSLATSKTILVIQSYPPSHPMISWLLCPRSPMAPSKTPRNYALHSCWPFSISWKIQSIQKSKIPATVRRCESCSGEASPHSSRSSKRTWWTRSFLGPGTIGTDWCWNSWPEAECA